MDDTEPSPESKPGWAIPAESWLHEPRYAGLLAAFEFARTQQRLAVALSRIDPEDAVWLYLAMNRGYRAFERDVKAGLLTDPIRPVDPDDQPAPVAHGDFAATDFPFVVQAVDEDSGELLWFQRIENPTALTVPGFAPRKVTITITTSDGSRSIARSDGSTVHLPMPNPSSN